MVAFAALALQTKPTPTCVQLFIFLFSPPFACFCRLFLSFAALILLSCCHAGGHIWRMLLKFTDRSLHPSSPRRNWICFCGMRFSLCRRVEFPTAIRTVLNASCYTRFTMRSQRAFGFSHVTRASAARAWCSLRAQWAVSLCGSRMTLLHRMECDDVIPVAILKRCNDLHWRCTYAILRVARRRYVNHKKYLKSDSLFAIHTERKVLIIIITQKDRFCWSQLKI